MGTTLTPLLTLLLAQVVTPFPDQPRPVAQRLGFTLERERDSYHVGAVLLCRLRLRNVSSSPVLAIPSPEPRLGLALVYYRKDDESFGIIDFGKP